MQKIRTSAKLHPWSHTESLKCIAGASFLQDLAAVLHPEHGALIANLHGKLPQGVRALTGADLSGRYGRKCMAGRFEEPEMSGNTCSYEQSRRPDTQKHAMLIEPKGFMF